ncbi:MAG: 2-hydroxychromene-2-carboxylate isomerase [Bacteriovoracaceae bacterium]|nr:2-hydroxychromene-2-carboxylate isomerase [Bacteriovoracaceae bacterium]
MKLSYYFDFQSPYSYLSWQWVKKEIARGEHQIELIPVVLGQVIKHHDTKGPAEIPAKRDYLFKDCLRYSTKNGIKFCTPKQLPFNSLYALRMALASVAEKNQVLVIDSIYNAGWGEGKDIGSPEVLTEILCGVGLDGDWFLEQTTSKGARVELKVNVRDAIGRGLFGLPSFLCHDELFWGNDSIPSLEEFLKGNDCYNKDTFEKFVDTFKELK